MKSLCFSEFSVSSRLSRRTAWVYSYTIRHHFIYDCRMQQRHWKKDILKSVVQATSAGIYTSSVKMMRGGSFFTSLLMDSTISSVLKGGNDRQSPAEALNNETSSENYATSLLRTFQNDCDKLERKTNLLQLSSSSSSGRADLKPLLQSMLLRLR